MKHYRNRSAHRAMRDRRPSRKAVHAAMQAQAPLDMEMQAPVRKKARKLAEDAVPEIGPKDE